MVDTYYITNIISQFNNEFNVLHQFIFSFLNILTHLIFVPNVFFKFYECCHPLVCNIISMGSKSVSKEHMSIFGGKKTDEGDHPLSRDYL